MKDSKTFFTDLLNKPVRLLTPDPQQGPEGFPYLLVSNQQDGDHFIDILKWCANKGIGIVINPTETSADYIFTYGMIWNFFTRGEFITESTTSAATRKTLEFNDGKIVLTALPNESYWPSTARRIFKEFLLQQGIYSPKAILVLDHVAKGDVDLCFTAESLGLPPPSEQKGILEAFSWFFPLHYSLAIINEKHLLSASFLSF